MAQIDILNQHRGNYPNPYDGAVFGRVGNVEDGQGFYRTNKADESSRVDDTGTYIYVGKAIPGSEESSAVWKIKRVEVATGNTLYADGNAYYDNIWDDRASMTYS